MKAMKKILFAGCLSILFFPSLVLASNPAREQIIENQLNCMSDHKFTWKEVCLNKATDADVEEEFDDSSNVDSKYSDFWYRPFDRENFAVDLGMGTEVYRSTYEEPDFMRNKGFMYGVYGYYAIHLSDLTQPRTLKDAVRDSQKLNMFKLETRFAFGEVDYDSNGTGSVDDLEDFVFEIRGVTGYDFPIGNAVVVTPFFGVGYRYLNDDSGGRVTTTGHLGYERESNYVYLPIGAELVTGFGQPWSFGVTAEYDLFIAGTQKSHLEDVSSSFATLENDQESGWGVRGSLKIMRHTPVFDLVFEPFIRYWKIDDSKVSPVTYSGALVGYGLEPANETTEIGGRIGIQF